MHEEAPVLTLIMPVYNDGEAIIPVVSTLFLTVNYSFKLIVVYDFNDDKTIDSIKKLQQHFRGIYLFKNEFGTGVLNAIKTGFKQTDTPYLGIWLSYHVDPYGVLNDMMKKLENGYDLVSANRFTISGKRARGGIFKRLLSYWGNLVLQKLIGMPIRDVTTSIKLYRKTLLEHLNIETTTSGGWAVNAELAIKAAINGFRLAEVAIERKNINLIYGVTNFKILKQLPIYLRWLFWGWKNRRLISQASHGLH